ncbi:EpsG family protein [Marinilactibacillus psychrotolerans]|uniref:EpsG family protein n=1 Tax=Marinilactibacillus psychrotolerans TaxID=191770 RepID=UPI003830C17A
MVFLVLFYLFIYLLALLNLNFKNRTIRYFLLIIMFLFSALRRNVGTDFEAYLSIQRGAYYDMNLVYFEPFHKLLYYLGVMIEYDYTYFILTTIFIFYFLFKLLKDNNNISDLIVFFFLTSGFYFYSLNGIRFFMSVIIFLYSYKYIDTNKVKYYIYILFAITVHYTAIVLLFIPFLLKTFKRIPLKVYLFVIVVSFLFSNQISTVFESIISFLPILNNYTYYFEVESGMLNIKHILDRLSLFVLTYYIILNIKGSKINDILYIFIIGVILKLVLDQSLVRISLYFTMTQILLFPMLYKDYNNKYIPLVLVLYSSFVYFVYIYTNTSDILGML